ETQCNVKKKHKHRFSKYKYCGLYRQVPCAGRQVLQCSGSDAHACDPALWRRRGLTDRRGREQGDQCCGSTASGFASPPAGTLERHHPHPPT
ncbi:unnamed protein product, partial [Lampetra planeri]